MPSDVPLGAAGTPPDPAALLVAGSTAKATAKVPQAVPLAAKSGAPANEAVVAARCGPGWPSSVAPTVARRQSTWAGRRLWTWPLPLNSRQTLKEALSARDGQNSITSVKTDLVWPTLTDDKSDTKGMVLFYEEFEDVCPRQQLSRHECAREVVGAPCPLQGLPPEDVHQRLPGCLEVRRGHLGPRGGVPAHQEQALDFQREPGEEREVRVDGEHVALTKGRLTGHQFEPIFEASIADLEAVGLPPHLQKEIRSDKRLWPGDAKEVGLRSPPRGRSATKSCWSTTAKGSPPCGGSLYVHQHPW